MAKTVTDPTPSQFNEQALVVALVLIALGILVFIFASVIVGGVIALLGAVFGLGGQVARSVPLE